MGILFPPLNIGAHYDLIALHIQNNLKFSWEEKEETSKAYFSDSLFSPSKSCFLKTPLKVMLQVIDSTFEN